jgi:hypothetical protein
VSLTSGAPERYIVPAPLVTPVVLPVISHGRGKDIERNMLYLQYYLGSLTDLQDRGVTRIFPRPCLVNQLQILNNTVNVLCHAYIFMRLFPRSVENFHSQKQSAHFQEICRLSDMMDEGDIHRKTV